MPVWNGARTVATALRSVVRQSCGDWECVVVDDGSTDGTADVVTAIASGEPRITLLSRPHAGIVAALNAGLEEARGALIARMDADDVMHRRRLERQRRALDADRTMSAVGCHVRLFPRARLSERRREYEQWLNSLQSAADVARDAFIECPIAHPTLMMRRDLAALRYVDRGWPEDYDLVLRALAQRMRLGVVRERLLSWRDDPGRLSRNDPRYTLEQFTACKAHYLAAGFLARTSTYVLWGYGSTGRALRRALARLGRTPSHIIEVKSSRIGQRIHGAPVVSVAEVPSLRGEPLIVSVARAGPRTEIRQALAAMDFCEGADFLCAA